MYCQNCGKEIPNDSVFCPECGVKQTDQQPIQQNIVENNKMKFCENCGCKIPIDSRFCPECRAKQSNSTTKLQEKTQQKGYVQQRNVTLSPEDELKIKKRNKIIGLSFAGLVAICVIIVLVSSFVKPSINLNKYITLSAEGYDTVGKVVISFDGEKFEKDYEKKLSSATKNKLKSSNVYNSQDTYIEYMFNSYNEDTSSKYFLSRVISGSVDTTDHLSNGDVITYTWNCDDDFALETYGVKLKYSEIKYTVDGLETAKTFDLFDGIEISFSGIAPNGYAEINGSPNVKAAENFRYDINQRDGLSVGDIVTVTASVYYNDDPIQYCIENYGMIPESLTKDFTVKDLNSYIKTIDDISDECLKLMQSQAEDVYNAKIATNFGDDETLVDFTYVGNYLLTAKNNDSWSNNNILYLVYKVTVNDNYSSEDQKYNKNNEFYWYISFYDLLVSDLDETTVEITNYRTPGDYITIDSGISSGWWSNKVWNYAGYSTISDLYRVAVTQNIDTFNHQENINEDLVPNVQIEEEMNDSIIEEGIIFPNSSEELINKNNIESLSDEDLRYAINELYARHGYIFKDEGLKTYYEQFDWYEGQIKSDDFSMELFNETEIENIEMLQKERDSRN